MLTIAKLFGKSPFLPLQKHMACVSTCVDKLAEMIEALPTLKEEEIQSFVKEISKLEHRADLTKNDIRNHLPRSLFMPIDRGHFLDILSLQDAIADKAEDISILLTLRPLEPFKAFPNQVTHFFKANIDVFHMAKHIIEEIDTLLESSFGGIEAQKVKAMVEKTAHKEWEADNEMHALMKELFTHGDTLSIPGFQLWLRLIKEISTLADISEKLANRIRMVLELK